MNDHYDVIVIGSGAGGGTLTHALAPTGARVLLLERGGWLPREAENWSPSAVWAEGRYHNSGTWTDQDGKSFKPKQHYYVGGNTKMYGAILFRFRERDFESIEHVDGISPAWPISYADLEPWYTRAERLYQVHGRRGSDPTEPPATEGYPYPAITDEPRIAQLNRDLAGAGLNPFPLPNGILIDESAPERSACVRCATCDGFPCLVNGKADAQVVCVEPALRYPNVTLLTGAFVTRLETDAPGRRVERVVVERDGVTETYTADMVVVAGGAINSAALLLRSASDTHPDGLGNSSGVVGRHLMLHNNSSLIAFSTMPNPTKFQKTLGINDYYFGDGDWPYPLGAMQMLGKSDAVLIGFDVPDAADPAELARHSIDFWLTTEDLPLPQNRVTLDADGEIRLSYTPTNLEAHQRLREKFMGLLDTIRCRADVYENRQYVGGRLGIGGVAHQNGTIRFGTDPKTSALDLDCKLHDLDNVYVADSSFFVSSTAVNPTLTIIANALRVAETVAQRLGRSTPQSAQPVTTLPVFETAVVDFTSGDRHDNHLYVTTDTAVRVAVLKHERSVTAMSVRTRRILDQPGVDAVLSSAEAAAVAGGYRVVIVIVDASGRVLALRRTEGSQAASDQVAIDKARTAAIFVRPSRDIEQQVTDGRLGALALHGARALTGGIPLRIGDEVVGAIGTSGETPDEDESVSIAGAAARFSTVEVPALSYAAARTAARSVARMATERAVAPVAAVVDAGGELVYLWRPDAAQVASVGVATDKARTAAIFRRPSKDFEDQASGGRPSALHLAGAVPLQGGMPIVVDGHVVGAIGVSGASSADEDQELAVVGQSAGQLAASATPPPTAMHISDAALQKKFATGGLLLDTDEYKVDAGRRVSPGEVELHRDVVDIMHVVQGAAKVVTGGTLRGPREVAPGELRAEAIEGGTSHELSPGDVFVIPDGVPHQFVDVTDPFRYLVTKVEA